LAIFLSELTQFYRKTLKMKSILFLIVLICVLNFSNGAPIQYCQPVTLGQLSTCSMISGSVFVPPEFKSIYDLDSYINSYIGELKSLGYVAGSTCETAIELFLCSAAFLHCEVLLVNCTSPSCKNTYRNCTTFNNYTNNLIINNTINLNNTCYDNTIIVNGIVLQLTPPCRNPCLYARSSCPSVDPQFLEEFDCEATLVEQGPLGQRIELPLFPIENTYYPCINYDEFIKTASGSVSATTSEPVRTSSSEKPYFAFTAMLTVIVAYIFVNLFAR